MGSVGRTPLEPGNHSFIVKIWLEETAEEASRATWRGHITHVPSGARLYLSDLDDISAIIMPYLEEVGIKFGVCWRLRQWLYRRKRSLMR
jgi:hypothetical protein